jgi:hypothetical protein
MGPLMNESRDLWCKAIIRKLAVILGVFPVMLAQVSLLK